MQRLPSRRRLQRSPAAALLAGLLALGGGEARAHVVPPEKLHPAAESYRRLTFVLNLNPVPWELATGDAAVIAEALAVVDPEAAGSYRAAVASATAAVAAPAAGDEGPAPEARRAAARGLFELSTRALARTLTGHLEAARRSLAEYSLAARAYGQARQLWAAFEPEIAATDRPAFAVMGECWLEMVDALGSPGILGVGEVAPDAETFGRESGEVIAYLAASFGDGFRAADPPGLAPLPIASPSFAAAAEVPVRLPPGSDLNKQLPRPRQILNIAARGVDESETPLIALGDMAFDSPFIFGEPARSLAVSCNSCHNKGVTNPGLEIPGLSSAAGGIDVANSFFAPHANDGRFAPLDVPDLRGIRFTAPYGRNGRFDSLREFVRNVIVNEFNGPEPAPLLLDGIVAYMLEFDFLPNSDLGADGRLRPTASAAARRGEEIFHRPFPGLGGRSCATCHVPSDHFLDRKRHDVGTVAGAGPGSRDGALDTPTLLSARYTAPYFHDGSQPTLAAVSRWFDQRFGLGLSAAELDDLTAYVETVGSGVDAYEDTVHTLAAELEEFSFFLSTYGLLRQRGETGLIDTTLRTVAQEIRAHKWDVQDPAYLPLLERLAELMDEAAAANARGDRETADARIAAYLELYGDNVEVLR